MPFVVDLLLGEDHDRIVLVDPSVIYHPLDQIHPVGKVDGIPSGTVVEHIVPGLVEEPEQTLGYHESLDGMVVGIQGDDHTKVGLVDQPGEVAPEDPADDGADEDVPVLPKK